MESLIIISTGLCILAILSGMLGVGPGFLLLPTMILLCYEPKHAAAITAVVVTLPSFSALIPHISTAKIDLNTMLVLVVVGAVGSFLGARITSLWVPGKRLKQMFGVLIVLMSAYKLYTLLQALHHPKPSPCTNQ